ncbi:MAG: ribbon-helix-helix domain-containing protein [Patescibacteria group bacterium]
MSTTIVNFSIPAQLDKKIKRKISEQGFSSKAEFFRMAAVNYLGQDKEMNTEDRLELLTRAISDEVRRKFKGKKMPSVRKQLAD